MRKSGVGARVLMVGALALGIAGTAEAQARPTGRAGGARPTTARPAAGRPAGRGAVGTPRGDDARARLKNATPEQKAYAKALAEQQKKIRADIKAGTLDRKSAAEALKAWRAANPAPKRKPTP